MTMANFEITFENPWCFRADPDQTIVVQAKNEVNAIRKFNRIAPGMVSFKVRRVDKIPMFRVYYRYWWNDDKPGKERSELVRARHADIAMRRLALIYEGAEILGCYNILNKDVYIKPLAIDKQKIRCTGSRPCDDPVIE